MIEIRQSLSSNSEPEPEWWDHCSQNDVPLILSSRNDAPGIYSIGSRIANTGKRSKWPNRICWFFCALKHTLLMNKHERWIYRISIGIVRLYFAGILGFELALQSVGFQIVISFIVVIFGPWLPRNQWTDSTDLIRQTHIWVPNNMITNDMKWSFIIVEQVGCFGLQHSAHTYFATVLMPTSFALALDHWAVGISI